MRGRGLESAQRSGLANGLSDQQAAGFARELSAKKGLSAYFERVFGGDDFERKEPDPLPLIKTYKALGTLPASTWLIL